MDDAETCRRKMTAAAALIEGLGGEKIRWTEQSQEFKSQIGRSVSRNNINLFEFDLYFWRMHFTAFRSRRSCDRIST